MRPRNVERSSLSRHLLPEDERGGNASVEPKDDPASPAFAESRASGRNRVERTLLCRWRTTATYLEAAPDGKKRSALGACRPTERDHHGDKWQRFTAGSRTRYPANGGSVIPVVGRSSSRLAVDRLKLRKLFAIKRVKRKPTRPRLYPVSRGYSK